MTRTTLLLTLLTFNVHAQSPISCPASPASAQGKNFQGQTLIGTNFSHQDLTNANFQGAILNGVFFGKANLTGANFSGATITNDSSRPNMAADFTFANLDSACFINATFSGRTYFTYATLTCADFSQTDINNGNAVFGGSLVLDTGRSCRTAFRLSTMNCEFLNNWLSLDLTGAKINACYAQLAGRDFTNAKMASVDFTGAILDNTKFIRADLSEATLIKTSLQKADLSYATLFGAVLNNANLTGANLYHAFLANNNDGNISQSATLQQSHLKNVNLSFAELSGVNFTYANFYGDNSTGSGGCTTEASNYEGFTCSCASAHGATMIDTIFTNAYLFGVDFSSTQIKGVDFLQAVLVGTNFAGAELTANPNSGRATSMTRALLQGANLGTAQLSNVQLNDAFVDFREGGNNIYIFLTGSNHNDFACPASSSCTPPSGADVCVEVSYAQATTVPADNSTITCPNGGIGNCGAADPSGSNAKWRSTISDIGNPSSGIPPTWYDQDATYTKAPSNTSLVCSGKGTAGAVILW